MADPEPASGTCGPFTLEGCPRCGATVSGDHGCIKYELPEAFRESTTYADLCGARLLLQEGLALERRGDDHAARSHFVNALLLVDKLAQLNAPKPRMQGGRQVCGEPSCETKPIMPNGFCIFHGGE